MCASKVDPRDAWSLYWQADRLDSCCPARDPADAAAIHDHWRALADAVPKDGAVLDLATGNGAVLLRMADRMAETGRRAALTGVDLAAIDPGRYVRGAGGRAQVRFMGGVDLAALPFDDGAFDLVTSQFGFEYAPRAAAAREAARVLRPGGRLSLLLHHVDSVVYRPNTAQIQELDGLLADGGVVGCLLEFLEAPGAAAMTRLEAAGTRYQAGYPGGLPRLSRQVFDSVGTLLNRQDLGPEVRCQAGHDMRRRMLAERARMEQLQQAGLDGDAAQALVAMLDQAGVRGTITPFRNGAGLLIGWLYAGERRA
ncbi:class I SAM-dependent methyltransferase [Yunchengibacter salinarum]|uniref:class I SAM-dependent methyltransferase n=1 Tax=Yunchengibacter salinarum TaxID=3133399 RepID=UPI0035B5E763